MGLQRAHQCGTVINGYPFTLNQGGTFGKNGDVSCGAANIKNNRIFSDMAQRDYPHNACCGSGKNCLHGNHPGKIKGHCAAVCF